MLVPDDPRLIGDLHLDHGIVVEDDALAAKARFQSGVDGAVDEVFLFVGDLFQKVVAGLDIDVAGTAGANATAIVIEVHAIVLGHFQYTISFFNVLDRYGRDVGVFECEFHGCHDSSICDRFFSLQRYSIQAILEPVGEFNSGLQTANFVSSCPDIICAG